MNRRSRQPMGVIKRTLLRLRAALEPPVKVERSCPEAANRMREIRRSIYRKLARRLRQNDAGGADTSEGPLLATD